MDFSIPTLVSHRLTLKSKSTVGVLCAIAAYLWWGFATPLYFKLFKQVPVVELVIWRVLSGLPILLLLLYFRKQVVSCFQALRDKRTLLLLLISSAMISLNWTVYVISVVTDRLLDSSLGYYINPIVTVLFGFLFLGERLRKMQLVAVGIALIGVVYLTIVQGSLPWIAVSLAGTFALYGLFRKIMKVGSIEGLAIEMSFALPICIVLQVWLLSNGKAEIISGNSLILIGLLLGGIVTIVPLLFFASGARRLNLSTIGILQYMAPSGQFLLAVLVFNEPFTFHRQVVFSLIWIAVGLYSFDAWKSSRQIQNKKVVDPRKARP